jgi:hypothetical protein
MTTIFSPRLNPGVKPPAKQPHLAGGYAAAMDVSFTRLRNLALLVEQIEHSAPGKRKKDVALDLDMSASFLSQLLGGKKMGDDVARKIEAARSLPRGWMDHPQWSSADRIGEGETPAYSPSQAMGISPEILAASYQLVRRACEVLEVAFDPESAEDASIVLLGCSYLHARRETAVTVDNVVDFTKLMRKRQGEVHAVPGSASIGSTRAGTGP